MSVQHVKCSITASAYADATPFAARKAKAAKVITVSVVNDGPNQSSAIPAAAPSLRPCGIACRNPQHRERRAARTSDFNGVDDVAAVPGTDRDRSVVTVLRHERVHVFEDRHPSSLATG